MKFIPYEIRYEESYLFSIETPQKPDSPLQEWITRSINEAMEAVKLLHAPRRGESGEKGEPYVTRWECMFTRGQGPGTPEEEDLSKIEFGRDYIVFGILHSGAESKDQLSKEELEELRDSTAEKIERLRDPTDPGKMALVILQDCTVNRQIFPGYRGIELLW